MCRNSQVAVRVVRLIHKSPGGNRGASLWVLTDHGVDVRVWARTSGLDRRASQRPGMRGRGSYAHKHGKASPKIHHSGPRGPPMPGREEIWHNTNYATSVHEAIGERRVPWCLKCRQIDGSDQAIQPTRKQARDVLFREALVSVAAWEKYRRRGRKAAIHHRLGSAMLAQDKPRWVDETDKPNCSRWWCQVLERAGARVCPCTPVVCCRHAQCNRQQVPRAERRSKAMALDCTEQRMPYACPIWFVRNIKEQNV